MKYHNITHWDNVLNIDDILSEYEKDKIKILSLIKHNPKELATIWNDILGRDDRCQMKMKFKSDIACSNCTNMTHILDINDNYDEPFIGDSGSLEGKELLLTSTEVPYSYLNYNKGVLKCDPFTLKVLLLWILEEYTTAMKLKIAFICNYVGYTLYIAPTVKHQLCNYDTFLTFKPKDVYGLLGQLMIIFDELKLINFNLGNPSIYSFLFDEKPFSKTLSIPESKDSKTYKPTEGKNKLIEYPYTLYLADVSKSSLLINNLHISSDNKICDIKSYNKFIETKGDKYKLKNHFDVSDIKNKPGLDFYFTLISMFENEQFIKILKQDEKSLNLYKQLLDEDFSKINNLEEMWLYKDPVQIALNLY